MQRVCFKCLRQNIILSKYELKKRLEKMSCASFVDRHTCQRCFQRWANRSRIVLQLDNLEEKVEGMRLKAALVRWALFTWPVLPPQPKLSFAEKMKARFAWLPVVAAPPTSLIVEQDALNKREEKRRQRMLNALRATRK